jgi:hypothetical protein
MEGRGGRTLARKLLPVHRNTVTSSSAIPSGCRHRLRAHRSASPRSLRKLATEDMKDAARDEPGRRGPPPTPMTASSSAASSRSMPVGGNAEACVDGGGASVAGVLLGRARGIECGSIAELLDGVRLVLAARVMPPLSIGV